jgi:hypothetical protein
MSQIPFHSSCKNAKKYFQKGSSLARASSNRSAVPIFAPSHFKLAILNFRKKIQLIFFQRKKT